MSSGQDWEEDDEEAQDEIRAREEPSFSKADFQVWRSDGGTRILAIPTRSFPPPTFIWPRWHRAALS